MATRNSIRPWWSCVRRSAHIYANWCRHDAAPSSNHRNGVAGQRMVQRERYGRRDGHRCGMPLPQRLGLGGRCCSDSSLSCWCRPACYRGAFGNASGLASGLCRCHHYRCLSRVEVVVWTASPIWPLLAPQRIAVGMLWKDFFLDDACFTVMDIAIPSLMDGDHFFPFPLLTTNVDSLTQLGYEYVLRFRHIFLLYFL